MRVVISKRTTKDSLDHQFEEVMARLESAAAKESERQLSEDFPISNGIIPHQLSDEERIENLISGMRNKSRE